MIDVFWFILWGLICLALLCLAAILVLLTYYIFRIVIHGAREAMKKEKTNVS